MCDNCRAFIASEHPPEVRVEDLYRPSRICVTDYVVTDHAADAADLLDRAASIMNELVRRGVFTHGVIAGAADAQPDVVCWFGDYDALARR